MVNALRNLLVPKGKPAAKWPEVVLSKCSFQEKILKLTLQPQSHIGELRFQYAKARRRRKSYWNCTITKDPSMRFYHKNDVQFNFFTDVEFHNARLARDSKRKIRPRKPRVLRLSLFCSTKIWRCFIRAQ